MSSLNSALQKVLQRPIDPKRATLYDLIGVAPFEGDIGKIEKAVQECIHLYRMHASTIEAEDRDKIGQLIQQAKGVLLVPEKKKGYDQKLREAPVRKEAPAMSPRTEPSVRPMAYAGAGTTSSGSSAWSASWLPAGDPNASFDMPAYVHSSLANSFSNVEDQWSVQARLDELARELGVPSTELVPVELTANVPVETPLVAVPSLASVSAAAVRSPISSRVSRSPASSVKTLQKKRFLSNALAVGFMLLFAGGLIGFASWMILSQSQKPADKGLLKVDRGGVVLQEKEPPKTDELGMPTERPKGREKPRMNQPGVGAGKSKFDLNRPEDPNESNKPIATVDSMMEKMKDPPMASPDMPMKNDAMPPAAMPPAAMPSNPEPASTSSTPPMEMPDKGGAAMMNEGPSDQPQTDDEKKEILSLLKSARAAIDDWDFKTFNTKIEKAHDMAREREWVDRVARLDQLGQLQSNFVDALKVSIEKLNSGDVIRVMQSEVAFVERKGDEITIKAAGTIRSYKLREIPIGMALGLADLSLSDVVPEDLAARGVYCLLHSKQDGKQAQAKKLADEFLSKAMKSDKIRPDLRKAVTDNFKE